MSVSPSNSQANREEDPAWTRLADGAARALRALDKCTASVKRTADRLKAARDVPKAQEKVRATADEARAAVVQVQETLAMMERYVRVHKASGGLVGKVAVEARASITAFERQHEDFLTRAATIEHEARTVAGGAAGAAGGGVGRGGAGGRGSAAAAAAMEEGDEMDDRHALVAGDAARQQQALERELHDEIMEQRARECRAIAESVADINEIFRHLNEIVGEQGVKLEMIETNTENAEAKTRQAAEELRKARAHQDRERQRNFFLLIVVIIVVVVVVGIFSSK